MSEVSEVIAKETQSLRGAHLKQYQFTKGNPGRPKGIPSKTAWIVRKALAGAFEDIGGMEVFVQWAKNNQTDFYTKLWVKLLPNTVDDDDDSAKDAILNLSALSEVELATFRAILGKMTPNSDSVEILKEGMSPAPSGASTDAPVPTIPPPDVPKVAP